MTKQCAKCGGTLEKGRTGTKGVRIGSDAHLIFIVPAEEKTALNPFAAFRQGLEGKVAKSYAIEGYRCAACGALELYATEAI